MTIFEIAAGVCAGVLLAAGFLWCMKAAATPDVESVPWWSILGMLVITAFIVLVVIGSAPPR